ncbi:TPM domain-containing protein [Candidatus Peribacteria bacterium]|nr:MAG: TPM domain-containing protein [Candidatus Peribacteria bacterium]
MTTTRLSLFGLGLCALFLVSAPAHAFELPENDGYVTDAAGIFTPEQKDSLEQNLKEYDQSTSNQLAVLTVQSLSGADIAEVALEAMRTWGVGQKDKNNGALMLIAYQDRSIWIATGYGLEGALPDLVVKGIVETDIIPAFRDGEYADGIESAVESMKKHIGGEYTADRYAAEESSGMFPWILFLVFIGFNWLAASFAKSKSWWAGGVAGGVLGIVLTVLYAWWLSIPVLVALGLFFDYIVSKHSHLFKGGRGGRGGMWGGGGFGGSSGGGGFGGFGGGSSGGGGAGGKW